MGTYREGRSIRAADDDGGEEGEDGDDGDEEGRMAARRRRGKYKIKRRTEVRWRLKDVGTPPDEGVEEEKGKKEGCSQVTK